MFTFCQQTHEFAITLLCDCKVTLSFPFDQIEQKENAKIIQISYNRYKLRPKKSQFRGNETFSSHKMMRKRKENPIFASKLKTINN